MFMKRILKDKALVKTIKYRILAGVGGALIMLAVTGANPIAITAGGLAGEVYRTGAYYWMEINEKPKEKEPKQPELELHEYHKKYGVDELNETRR